MGENFGFWFPQHQVNWKISNLNSLAGPFPSRQENPVPPAMKPISSPVSVNGELPVDGYPDISNQPHGWFYCLPRFRQAFMPSSNSGLKEHLHQAAPKENPEETIKPDAGSGSTAQKRFLVFDQTGDQTTLIYSSGIGTPPVQCLTSWSSKPPGTYNFTGENGLQKGDVNLLHSGSNLVDILDGSNVNDVQSEMHEDTEELNALLYSDDDDDIDDESSDDDDDEVTSTGHSPSTMTANEAREWFEEEVASSFEPSTTTSTSRKRKLFDSNDDDDNDNGCYDDVPSPLMVTGVCSSKVNRPQLGNEDDAESSCGNSCNPRLGEIGPSSWGVKRMRKEKIRETVGVLRRIIPHGKGKDALVVIDEAIDYLKSLKLVAKEFGLESHF